MADDLSPSEVRATALRGLRSIVIARPAAELVLLGSTVVLARLITPADFGRYAVAFLVSGLGLVPLSGLEAALVQREEPDRSHLQSLFGLCLLAAVGFCLLALIGARLIVEPIFGGRTADFVRISTIGTLISAFNMVPAALLQRRLSIKRLSILDVVNTAAGAVASIVLAILGWGGYALVVGGLGGVLTMTAINWVWAPPPLPWVHRQAARDLLRFAVPQSGAGWAWVGFANIDYAIVGAILGPRQAGYYSRAYIVGVNYKSKISQVLSTIGFPVLARVRDQQEMAAIRRQMVRPLTIIVFPLLAFLVVTAPVLIPAVFGRRWSPAVTPTQILAIGGATTLAIDAAGTALMAAGRTRALLAFGWAHLLSYGGLVLAVAHLGIVNVAIAAACDHAVFMLISYRMMLRQPARAALRYLWQDIGPGVVCGAMFGAIAVPTSALLASIHTTTILYLISVSAFPGAVSALGVRLFYPEAWRIATVIIGQVLPGRLQLGWGLGRLVHPKGLSH